MKITKEATDDVILAELGARLAQVRLGKNLTQAQLAEKAGVGKRTVERMETGAVAPQLAGFVRICRALELVERFELLVPEPVASPMAELKLGAKRRRRASATGAAALAPTMTASAAKVTYPEGGDRRKGGFVAERAQPKWTWGDEK